MHCRTINTVAMILIVASAGLPLARADSGSSQFSLDSVKNEERPDVSKATILALDEGATLIPCQSFHWRGTPDATRYRLAVGSYPDGDDVFSGDATIGVSASVQLPADGRQLYVTLFTESRGKWRKVSYQYRSPSGDSLESCEASFPGRVGVYHWAGVGTRSISDGVDQFRRIGGRVIRLTMSPRYYQDYNIADACYEDYSLTALAREPDVARALGEPSFSAYMITAYDGVSFGDCRTAHFLNPRFYTEDIRARIVEEYSDFTFHLYESYAGTGKQFLLSNWEGDNQIYCGEGYRYAKDEAFRSWCDENYSTLYSGNIDASESLEGLLRWFTARWEGIKAGQRRAAAGGYTGVSVHSAPEFSIVRSLRDGGYNSVLYDVIPEVPFDYVSYSAYESINRPDPVVELAADLATIREVTGADTVILGEIGFPRSVWGDSTVDRTHRIVEAALAWGVAYIFQWALYDHSATVDFGLIDEFGTETAIGSYYRSRLTQSAPSGVKRFSRGFNRFGELVSRRRRP